MQSFKEFLNAASFKPQATKLKQRLSKETGLQVSKDMSKPKKVVTRKLRNAVKAPTPPSLSTVSSALKKQRLTNPKNRFKIRKGSSLDSNPTRQV